MRLDKYISYALNLTRNEARNVIKNGSIKVDGEVVRSTNFHLNELVDKVSYLEEVLSYKNFIYLMLNKPSDYVSATVDNVHKTVLDLISGYEKYDLSIAGRLDKDVEGLIILSNDGKFLHALTSPNKNVKKLYYVIVDKEFTEADVKSFKDGFELLDGKNEAYFTKEASLKVLSPYEAYIEISEGKFHQVKRMCEKIGKTVSHLRRIKIGTLELDSNLKPGEYRELTSEEVLSLKEI